MEKKLSYFELMEMASEYVAEAKISMSNPQVVIKFLRPLVQDLKQETFFALLLNAKNEVTEIKTISLGLADRAQAHPREVFRAAIVANAVSIIIAHNHPSGNPQPSVADIAVTKKLVEAGEIVGIGVLDHIVLGQKTEIRTEDYFSFQKEGILHS
jgi:DNA repair protein RadC